MSAKHTPGPWTVVVDPRDSHAYDVVGANGCKLTRGYWGEWAKADARLLAAAPEMLEALCSIENDDGSIPAAIWEMRCAAIAKATGSEQ